MRRKDWVAWLCENLGTMPGDDGFDTEFVHRVVTLLKECNFPNLANAIHCSAADLSEDEGHSRSEFDALVDLAIQLLVEEERAEP